MAVLTELPTSMSCRARSSEPRDAHQTEGPSRPAHPMALLYSVPYLSYRAGGGGLGGMLFGNFGSLVVGVLLVKL